jgi:hypothetical protein
MSPPEAETINANPLLRKMRGTAAPRSERCEYPSINPRAQRAGREGITKK